MVKLALAAGVKLKRCDCLDDAAHGVDIGGTRLQLDADHLAAVGPGTDRTLASGPDGMRVLIIGGAPGKAYEAPEWSSTGE